MLKDRDELYVDLLKNINNKEEYRKILNDIKRTCILTNSHIEKSIMEALEDSIDKTNEMDRLTVLNKLILSIILTDFMYQRLDCPTLVTKTFLEMR